MHKTYPYTYRLTAPSAWEHVATRNVFINEDHALKVNYKGRSKRPRKPEPVDITGINNPGTKTTIKRERTPS
jgi:hypothetical protein